MFRLKSALIVGDFGTALIQTPNFSCTEPNALIGLGGLYWEWLILEFYGILESYLATFKQIQSDIYIKIVYLTAFAKTWL